MLKQAIACAGLAVMAMASPAGSQLSPPKSAEQPLRIGATMSITGKAYSVGGSRISGYLDNEEARMTARAREATAARGGLTG